MKTVFVLKGDSFASVVSMFKARGWNVVSQMAAETFPGEVDLVCFTGGPDVSPHLYGEENTSSHCDPIRDVYEQEVYEEFLSSGVPMVGICRGGQFLNVMNGGKMVQDIHPRQSGDVECYIDWGMEEPIEDIILRVDHHQGMLRNPDIHVCGATFNKSLGRDIDYSLFYPETKCYCFQPHPEWGHKPTEELFFNLLKEYLDV